MVLWPVVVRGEPIGKPRMTKRDKWKQRECVLRYRAWADAARAAAGVHLTALQSGDPKNVFVRAYFPLP